MDKRPLQIDVQPLSQDSGKMLFSSMDSFGTPAIDKFLFLSMAAPVTSIELTMFAAREKDFRCPYQQSHAAIMP